MKGKRIVGLSFVPRCTCSYKVRNIPLYISIAFIVDELCFYFTVLLLLWKKLFGEKSDNFIKPGLFNILGRVSLKQPLYATYSK